MDDLNQKKLDEAQLFRNIGQRDCAATILMRVRLKGERSALMEMAQELIQSDLENPNPHAKWYIENHPDI